MSQRVLQWIHFLEITTTRSVQRYKDFFAHFSIDNPLCGKDQDSRISCLPHSNCLRKLGKHPLDWSLVFPSVRVFMVPKLTSVDVIIWTKAIPECIDNIHIKMENGDFDTSILQKCPTLNCPQQEIELFEGWSTIQIDSASLLKAKLRSLYTAWRCGEVWRGPVE